MEITEIVQVLYCIVDCTWKSSFSVIISITLGEFCRQKIILDTTTGIAMASWFFFWTFKSRFFISTSELRCKWILGRMWEKLCWNFKGNQSVKWKQHDTTEHHKCSFTASIVFSPLEALQTHNYQTFCDCILLLKWEQKVLCSFHPQSLPRLAMEPRGFFVYQ